MADISPSFKKISADDSLKESIKSKYIKGYSIDNQNLDAYDPYHTTDAKNEEFWGVDGKSVQRINDDDTYTFKRGLYTQYGLRQNDFWYEDPFIPSFEIFFNENSPFFNDRSEPNCLRYFIDKYSQIDPTGYNNRLDLWQEFKKVFFKIFEKDLQDNQNRNIQNKPYYITKISGLNNLNKKMIKYNEDKITITINEDVSMIAWYLSELYNNISYSYRNQRFMFPENLLRFDMTIKINDMRIFQVPNSNNTSSPTVPVDSNYTGKDIKYNLSPKSQIIYTLHDCNFNFFESKNYGDDLEIGGYGVGTPTPSNLSFDIFFKSVTRYSKYPLIENGYSINAWGDSLYTKNNESGDKGTKQNYYNDLDRIKNETEPTQKSYNTKNISSAKDYVYNQSSFSLETELRQDRVKTNNIAYEDYLNQTQRTKKNNTDINLGTITPKTNLLNDLFEKSKRTITSQGVNYLYNVENRISQLRGEIVNDLLDQFRKKTTINKIEPDNVYDPGFNNNIKLENVGKSMASSLLNDLENTIKQTGNFLQDSVTPNFLKK
jgi:hypothetical protein